MTGTEIFLVVLAFVAFITILRTAVVVPQQSAYVVERLGRFHAVLQAGFSCCCRSSTSPSTPTSSWCA